MSLLSKARSLIPGGGDSTEKELRSQEKRYQKQLRSEQKEKKLESRRSIILASAADVLPSDDNRGKFRPEDYTAETPFKAAERHNPLFERRDAEKTEEERKIHKVSKVFNVNLSEAKVMLAKDPDILKRQNRPANGRSQSGVSSDGSYASSLASPQIGTPSSFNSGSMASPQVGSPGMASPRVRSPLTQQASNSGARFGSVPRDSYFPQSPHDSTYSESIYTPRIPQRSAGSAMQHSQHSHSAGRDRIEPLASPVITNEAELYDMAQRSR